MKWVKLKLVLFLFLLSIVGCGYHKPQVKVLPDADKVSKRTLFIAFDGISYDLMESLVKRGHFSSFKNKAPLVVTFPSATTVGFTGIFKPLNVGAVQGYETRFYSFDEGRIIGGTPKDIYKIHINYKTYFDSFRHTMIDKSVMYTFPGMAGRQDLERTSELLHKNKKNVLISYLGGTDGAQHLLGRRRTESFMKYADRTIEKIKKDYKKSTGQSLRVVLFSDHGFHFDRMKMIWGHDLERELEKGGYKSAKSLKSERDIVEVKYGLLSAGVLMTHPGHKETVARLIHNVTGIDLVFWPVANKIYILSHNGEEAYFEYLSNDTFRYVMTHGDPLKYKGIIPDGKYLNKKAWLEKTWNAYYPDAGYRLHDAFHGLVKNKASVLFSLNEQYQFGSLAAYAGTKFKLGGHKGTHGGLFRETSWGIVMTDDADISLPKAIRYDEMFPLFLKPVTDAYKKKIDVYMSHDAHAE